MKMIEVAGNLYVLATCERCGMNFQFHNVYLKRDSYDKTRCASCKQGPTAQISYDKEYCRPWQGDFDDEDNPMKLGKLYKPGKRTCGHKDCVRDVHIVAQ